ncbi:MAG TPA: hypothetical protein VHO95_05075, partial [Candidatus Dormibacteraeota bacterium]|nr:hypothetical protein [Candidatus Dormibacteraeota bacterium]
AGQQLVQSADCRGNLLAAEKRWPGSTLALDSTVFSGSGKWLVIDPDGRHFDQLAVSQQFNPLSQPVSRPGNSISLAAPSIGQFGTMNVLAGTIRSGSGGWSGSYCGAYYNYQYDVYYGTYYGANLDLRNWGTIDFCNWVSINEVPIVWGAGSWSQSNGTWYNGMENSYVYWYGQIWLCCSDSYQEWFSVGMYGDYYWSVTD